jgi:hypothetical protein
MKMTMAEVKEIVRKDRCPRCDGWISFGHAEGSICRWEKENRVAAGFGDRVPNWPDPRLK